MLTSTTKNICKNFAKKLIEFADNNYLDNREQNVYDQIMLAIRQADISLIHYYQGFGDCIHKIIDNNQTFEQMKMVGYTEYAFDSYGWIERPVPVCNAIPFKIKEDIGVKNYLEFGRFPNGQWTYGYWYSFGGGAGGCSSVSIFGDAFETEEDCRLDAFNYMLNLFEKAINENDTTNYKKDYCIKLKARIQQVYTELTTGCKVNTKGQVQLF